MERSNQKWSPKLYTKDFAEADRLRDKFLQAGYVPPEVDGKRQVKLLRCDDGETFVVKTRIKQE